MLTLDELQAAKEAAERFPENSGQYYYLIPKGECPELDEIDDGESDEPYVSVECNITASKLINRFPNLSKFG